MSHEARNNTDMNTQTKLTKAGGWPRWLWRIVRRFVPPGERAFRYPAGHLAGTTLTVAGLRAVLEKYPADMPVFAEREGVHAFVKDDAFSVSVTGKGFPDDQCEALIIDVNDYA